MSTEQSAPDPTPPLNLAEVRAELHRTDGRQHPFRTREFAEQLLAEVERLTVERDTLRQHILDIDAHATPYGDIPDEPGWVGTYLVTAGALHRALGKIGHSAPKCQAEAKLAELENAIVWDATCLSCATVLDSSMRQTERAEQAEQALAAARRELAEARTTLAAEISEALLAQRDHLRVLGHERGRDWSGRRSGLEEAAHIVRKIAAAAQSGTGSEPTMANCGCPISVRPMEVVDHTRECSKRRVSSAIATTDARQPSDCPPEWQRAWQGTGEPPESTVEGGDEIGRPDTWSTAQSITEEQQ